MSPPRGAVCHTVVHWHAFSVREENPDPAIFGVRRFVGAGCVHLATRRDVDPIRLESVSLQLIGHLRRAAFAQCEIVVERSARIRVADNRQPLTCGCATHETVGETGQGIARSVGQGRGIEREVGDRHVAEI